jgi:type IV secretory pathway VirB2 component (pilin)
MPQTPRPSAFTSFYLALFLALLLPATSYAQAAQPNAVAEVLCLVGGWINGPLGRLIGILGIICLGVAAMFGKIQISAVLTTIAGIALIFGAQSIVASMGLSSITQCAAQSAKDAQMIIDSDLYRMFACIISWFMGPIGKSLATLAIIVLGIFALYGKISYHQGLVVGAGIAAMFGGATIITGLGYDAGGVAYVGCSADNTFNVVYCSLVNWFNGPLGKGMATVGIIILGLGALYGKVSWGLAIIAGIGMALIFGGTTIVDALGGIGSAACNGSGISTNVTISVMFCNVVNWFNGPIGKGVATLAVIIVGLGALFGKVSWTMAIVVSMGVALIFGGTTIVSALGGPGDGACAYGNMQAPTGGTTGGAGGAGAGGQNGGWTGATGPLATLPLPIPGVGGVKSQNPTIPVIPGIPGTGGNTGGTNGAGGLGGVLGGILSQFTIPIPTIPNVTTGPGSFKIPTNTQSGTLNLPGLGNATLPAGSGPGTSVSLSTNGVLNGKSVTLNQGSVTVYGVPPNNQTVTIPIPGLFSGSSTSGGG